VQGDEQAVQDTKLYAPEDGTIVSLSGQVGETVSGSGTTKASTGSSSSSSSGAAGTGAATGAIIEHPDVQRMLLTMKAEVQAARGICHLTGVAIDLMSEQLDIVAEWALFATSRANSGWRWCVPRGCRC